jgi:hypothetical protein
MRKLARTTAPIVPTVPDSTATVNSSGRGDCNRNRDFNLNRSHDSRRRATDNVCNSIRAIIVNSVATILRERTFAGMTHLLHTRALPTATLAINLVAVRIDAALIDPTMINPVMIVPRANRRTRFRRAENAAATASAPRIATPGATSVCVHCQLSALQCHASSWHRRTRHTRLQIA